MNLLSVSGVSKKVGAELVIEKVSFSQPAFQRIAIAGETGSGKTTLLKMIAGLVQPGEGNIFFKSEKIMGPDDKLLPGHPEIAYLSQHFELRNNYRVEELLQYANKLPDEQAQAIFQVCRISHLLKRKTDQLSGGERQRIAAARLLLSSPELLLLDEPYSNLDPIHKQILKDVIFDISEKLKITCMLVSHDPLDILSWADEIIVLRKGKIIQQGSPREVYLHPADEYCASLFGRYILLDPPQAQLFFDLPPGENGSNLFIRPEHFKIVPHRDGAVAGIVNKVLFFGSFSEAEILLSSQIIIVKTAERNLIKGDAVYVALAPEKSWCL